MTKPNKTNGPGKTAKQPHPKPRPDFPLGPHPAGYWCKKVKGKLHYFGKIAGDEKGVAALERWLDEKDDLLAGRTPRAKQAGGLTIKDLCNRFLTYCDGKVAAGEMVARSRADYSQTTDRIVRVLGKGASVADLTPDDFARLRTDMTKGNGPVTVAGLISRARVVFNFAYKNLLIKTPVQYGMTFQRPSAKTLRVARAAKGEKMFEAADCRRIIDDAHTPELKAMVLLALNCGFGNSDCARLPIKAVDLKKGWIDYPRPKTGISRRCPLWPETIEALSAVLERRTPGRDLVFATKRGGAWADEKGGTTAVTNEFKDVLERQGLHKPGLGFYSLRHTFRTAADGCRDQVAVNHMMGHTPAAGDMSAVYRERIDDARLAAVAAHVRSWLYPPVPGVTTPDAATQAADKPAFRIVG